MPEIQELNRFELVLSNLLNFFCKKINYLSEKLIMAFIRLADLIINLDCVAAVKFSTYSGCCEGKDIPIVNICLKIPEGSLDEMECCSEKCQSDCSKEKANSVENLEFESDLALTIWDYFTKSSDVTVLFE
jgi:hypothetical protein